MLRLWQGLWIAFKLVPLHIKNNPHCGKTIKIQLWIAFKLVPLHIKNNSERRRSMSYVLWIAFKLVPLHIKNNQWKFPYIPKRIVNCFQISTFAYQKQLQFCDSSFITIVNCFQISTFAYQKQLAEIVGRKTMNCELLSN